MVYYLHRSRLSRLSQGGDEVVDGMKPHSVSHLSVPRIYLGKYLGTWVASCAPLARWVQRYIGSYTPLSLFPDPTTVNENMIADLRRPLWRAELDMPQIVAQPRRFTVTSHKSWSRSVCA